MLNPRAAAAFVSLPIFLLTGVLLTGCGSASSGTAAGRTDAKDVAIKLVDSGCDPTALNLPSGATTFKVTNGGTAKVVEMEITSGSKIQGEAENVVAGINKSFTLNLQPGTYGIHCPGGSSTTDGVLTVTGSSTTVATDVAGAVSNYRVYVEGKVTDLVSRTQAFAAAVEGGDVTKAKALYAPTRADYEAIEPIADSFADLDAAIDGRADDTPVDQITGFHRLENQLWTDNNTVGMTPIAQKLVADVNTLQTRIPGLDLDAAKIANGANDLLGEISKSKVTGEEDRYSHTDLSDFASNLEGSKAAITSVRAILDKNDPALGSTIDSRYNQVETDLAPYKNADGTYVLYTTLNQDQVKQLSQDIDALAEPVSQVAAKVVG